VQHRKTNQQKALFTVTVNLLPPRDILLQPRFGSAAAAKLFKITDCRQTLKMLLLLAAFTSGSTCSNVQFKF